MKRWVLGIVMVGMVGVAGHAYRKLNRRPLPEVILPEFSSLPSGLRAPSHEAFGQKIGGTSFVGLQAWAQARGLSCKDTSARELVRRMKAYKEAKAQGVDAVTSASSKRKSPMERNPQIRWTCEGTKDEQLGDRPSARAAGRALFVFDSPEHPLRHASFRRRHAAVSLALSDLSTSYERLTTQFGPPSTVNRPLPASGTESVPEYTPFTYMWRYADLKVVLKMVAYPGRRGIDIQEAIEVPWPVRSDAPTLPSPS